MNNRDILFDEYKKEVKKKDKYEQKIQKLEKELEESEEYINIDAKMKDKG